MCTLTATNVSAYCYTCVRILLYMCPHNATNVHAYCCVRVLILLYLCPHTATYVSLYYLLYLDEGDKKTSEVGVDKLEAKVLRNRRVFIL
jgi:hypothetical protein